MLYSIKRSEYPREDVPWVTSNPIEYLRSRRPEPEFDAERLLGLGIGESMVIALEKEGFLARVAVRIKRLPAYATNKVFYDTFGRENVLVTNGVCVLDHSTSESFAAHDNNGGCEYEALECYAIRASIGADGDLSVGTTMRRVNHAYLEEVRDQEQAHDVFRVVMTQYDTKKSPKLVGHTQ